VYRPKAIAKAITETETGYRNSVSTVPSIRGGIGEDLIELSNF
jgi:hypothetical protein